jgi:hypothetical protein
MKSPFANLPPPPNPNSEIIDAAKAGDTNAVLRLAYFTDVNARNQALQWALVHDDIDMITTLLDEGVSLGMRDAALRGVSARGGDMRALKLLVAGFQADRIGLQGPGIADFGAIA